MVCEVDVKDGATKFRISFTVTCGPADTNSVISIISTGTGVFATVLFLFLDPTKTLTVSGVFYSLNAVEKLFGYSGWLCIIRSGSIASKLSPFARLRALGTPDDAEY